MTIQRQRNAIDSSSAIGRYRNEIARSVRERINALYDPNNPLNLGALPPPQTSTSGGVQSRLNQVLLPASEQRQAELDPWMFDFLRLHRQAGVDPLDPTNLGGSPFWDRNATGKIWTSMGRILGFFFGLPMANECLRDDSQYDEVQFFWYNFGSNAGWYANQPITNFLVEKSEFSALMSDLFASYGVRVNVGVFLNEINSKIMRNPASLSFGFDKFYEASEADQPKLLDAYRENSAAFISDKNDLLRRSYQRFTTGSIDRTTPTFTPPRISAQVRVIPKINSETDGAPVVGSKGVCRVMISDASAFRWRGLASILQAARLQSVPIAREDLERQTQGDDYAREVVNYILSSQDPGLDVVVDPTTNAVSIRGGFTRLKNLYRKVMPTLIYRGEGTAATSARFQSNNNAQLSSIQIQRNLTGAGTTPSQSNVSNLPLRVDPSRISVSMLGMPYLDYGQFFFVDFLTGTTVDNIYMATGITHNFSPGKYTTDFEAVPPTDAYARFEGPLQAIGQAVATINSVGSSETESTIPSGPPVIPEE